MPKISIISSVHQALDNRIFYREARSLQKAGYDVTLIAHHTHSEIKDGIQIVPLSRKPRWQRPVLWIRILRNVINSRSEIYHFHDPELLLLSPFLRLLTRRPTIYDIHEATADFIDIKEDIPFIVRKILSGLVRWLEPFLAKKESGLIFADEQIASGYIKYNKPKMILYNFPERTFIDYAIKATDEQINKHPVILYLGGIKRNRGTSLMIEAFQLVLSNNPDAHLYLVGPFSPPSLKEEMIIEFTRHGMIESVTITDSIPFEKVSVYLKIAAVGWIPFPPVTKYQKNIPTKLFEYMAYALPVVSSDLAPVRPYITHLHNGYLVPPGDSKAHAKALLYLLDNPQQAAEMGKIGQKLVQSQYCWDEMESRLLTLYQQILSPKL